MLPLRNEWRRSLRRNVIAAIGALLLAMPGPAADIITLTDAVRLALQRNHAIREAAATIDAFRAREQQSLAAARPHAHGVLDYTRLGPVAEIEFSDFGTFKFYPADNYDFHVVAQYSLYDAGRLRGAADLARAQSDTAVDRVELLQRDIEFQAAQLYHSILFLRESVAVAGDHVKTLDEHLQVARQKLTSGTATELDVLSSEVRVAMARQQQLDIENALENQIILLGVLLGIDDLAPAALQGELVPPASQPQAMKGPERPEETRIEMRAVRHLESVAAWQFHLARLHDRPSLSVSLATGAKDGYPPHLTYLRLNFVASVRADIPIFDGRLGRHLQAEATANMMALAERRRQLEDSIHSEVLQTAVDLRSSEQKLQLVDVHIQQAAKALEYARLRYDAGTSTNLDLVDAAEDYLQARLLKLQSLYRCVASQLAWRRANGLHAIPERDG
jgi:outer membrane protein